MIHLSYIRMHLIHMIFYCKDSFLLAEIIIIKELTIYIFIHLCRELNKTQKTGLIDACKSNLMCLVFFFWLWLSTCDCEIRYEIYINKYNIKSFSFTSIFSSSFFSFFNSSRSERWMLEVSLIFQYVNFYIFLFLLIQQTV